MSICYVCEVATEKKNHKGVYICSNECNNSFALLCQVAQQDEVVKPKLKAYSDMSLFEPVDMELDQHDEYELGSFFGATCIQAVPVIDTDVIYIVKQKNDKIIFETRKKNAILFKNGQEAEKFINETLKPRYGDRWAFVVWSHSALIK